MQNHLHDTLGYFIILTSIVSNIPQLIKICIYKNDKNKVGERSLISFGFYCSINVMFIIYGFTSRPIEVVLIITNILLFLQSSSIAFLQCYFQSKMKICNKIGECCC